MRGSIRQPFTENTMDAITALIITAGLALAGPAGPPQDGTWHGPAPIVEPACCEAELDRAHELRTAGETRAAYRMYHAVARQQRAAGEFPGDALWQAAEISYALGNHARAARELDQVAAAAREFGRPNLEVRALLLAGHFHHLARQHDLARARIARVDRLLLSPELSDETRAWVTRRLETEANVS
jgi:hypothetical protein